MTTKELTYKDIRLVPETLDDAENIYQYMGCDPEITRYTGWNPYHSLESTIEKITRDIQSEDGSYSWVIKKENEFVGTIGAYDYHPEDGSIEIGYSIARKDWGNGFATAAAKAVVHFLLKKPQIHIIRAWSHKDNIASKKVLLAAGLIEVGADDQQIFYERKASEK